MAPRILRLTWELEQLQHASDAARLLCDAWRQDQFATEHDANAAPAAISAVLVLVEQRLRLLQSALRGDVPFELVAVHHNTTVERGPESESCPDVIALPVRKNRLPNVKQ